MATIARLDSNGIKVKIADTNRKLGDSPLVDSSTGPPIDQLLNENSNSNVSNPAPGNDGIRVARGMSLLDCYNTIIIYFS